MASKRITAIVDVDVLVSVLRADASAVAWYSTNPHITVAAPSIVIMELQQGCIDCILALQLHRAYFHGTGMGFADAFIAAIATNRDAPLLTLNVRHFEFVKGLTVEKPF